jgi:MFS family permease
VTCDVAPASIPEDEPTLLSRPLAVIMASAFVYFLSVGAMMPIVPRFVKEELDGGGLQVGIAVGAFAVSAAALRPWIGRMGDVHGRRILVVGGALLFGVSVMAYGVAFALPVLVLARLVTGAGEAAFFTGVATASQDLAPDHRRGETASYFSVALYAGLAMGPPLSEWLLRSTSFSTVFLVFGGCALVAALLGQRIAIGATDPDPPDRSLIHRAALWPGVVLALGLVPVVAYGAFLPLYGDEIGFDYVGPVLALYGGLILLVRIFGARLPDRVGWRRTSVLALAGVASGVGLVGVWGSPPAIWAGTVALAFGMSMLYPALLTAVMSGLPDNERGHAIGSFSLFFDLASGLGVTLVGFVVSLGGERSGFVAAAVCAAAGFVPLIRMRTVIGQPAEAP